MKKDYFKPNCPYKDRCKSKGWRCLSCKNNRDIKEDHYEPAENTPPAIIWYSSPCMSYYADNHDIKNKRKKVNL